MGSALNEVRPLNAKLSFGKQRMTDTNSKLQNFPLARELLFERLVHESIVRIRPRARKIEQTGVSAIGGMVLMSVLHLGEVPMQDIATQLHRDKSQITKQVSILRRTQLVSVSSLPEDRRIKRVRLTDDGRQIAEQLTSAWRKVTDEILEPLNSAQKKQFLDLLVYLYTF